MIAVIPMLGIGERFAKNGYSESKPFIRVNTEVLITKVVSNLYEHFSKIVIICSTENAEQVRALFDERVTIVQSATPTRGAAETVLLSYPQLGEREQIVCMDCDTVISQQALRKLPQVECNGILSFLDKDRTGLYSYLSLDGNRNILEIREKVAISDVANAGVYIFSNREVMKLACENVLEQTNELYLSKAIQVLIEQNHQVTSTDISGEFTCYGTPYQLQSQARNESGNKQLTICFDIDGTLVYDLYTNPTAIEKNVSFCNQAYKSGCKIILHTARGMLSTNSNAQEIEAKRPHIEKVLKQLNVCYDELVLMKPYADIYIDDKAIPAYKNLEKATGLYLSEEHTARAHNKIIVNGDTVEKQGSIEGENYYYETLPKELHKYFPTVISTTPQSLVLSRITKPTYSSLLLSQRLSKVDIDVLVDSLNIIHNTLSDNIEVDLNWAYGLKVRERFVKFNSLYKKLGVDTTQYENLCDNYFYNKYGRIHGDTVFTNIFAGDGKCNFIDMRGEWDNKLTVGGDIYYDFAKVMQSLTGYDYVLHNEPIQNEYLKSLREYFIDKLLQIHPTLSINELQNKVRLLYISLIPFHKDDLQRCGRFIKLLDSI
jgi:NDP-sugar pyrophosphorylase family protein